MMLNAPAPSTERGRPGFSLAVVMLALWGATASAQTPKSDQGATKKADAPAAKKGDGPASKAADGPATKGADAPGGQGQAGAAAKDEEALQPPPEAVVDAATAEKVDPVEVFKDPRAEAAMANTFPELPKPRPALQLSSIAGREDDVSRVRNMAGGAQTDPALLQRYVDYWASELTSHANINALTNPPEEARNQADVERASRLARAINRAVDALVDPVLIARERNNNVFLSAYNRALGTTLPKLLNNHLVARIEAMIVLGTTGSQDFLDIYIKQLGDSEQVVWVKHWAAVGLINAAQQGKVEMRDVQKSIAAAKALADFLEAEPDAPWPTRARAIEAIGSLRQSSLPLQNRASIAATLARILADPEARIDLRAWAAWSLGMVRVGGQVANYNFPLVAYLTGTAAADLGERIASAHETNPTQAQYYTALLLYQIFPAFEGVAEARESGLLRSPTVPAPDKSKIGELFRLVRDLGVASTQLAQAPGVQAEARRKDVAAKVSDLRAYLAKNAPKSPSLVPGDPPLLQGEEKVADAPAPRAR